MIRFIEVAVDYITSTSLWVWILIGLGIAFVRSVDKMAKEWKKTPEQRARERELRREAKMIADEINRNAWWI